MDFELFKKIAELPGVSGREEVVRSALVKLFKPHADEIRVDNMGNIIVFKKGKGVRKLLLAAHMDEIGLMVNHIDDNGFLRFVPVGGIDARTLLAQRVTVHTSKGPVMGVIGTKPVHLLDQGESAKGVNIKHLFIDVGMEAALVKGIVSVGDTVSLDRYATEFGTDFITSKSIDDRVGVYILLEVLKKIKKFDCDIYVAINTQEEVGLRGAITSTYGIDPDLGIIIDATAANDLPSTPAQEFNWVTAVHNAYCHAACGNTVNPQVVKVLRKLAVDGGIKHQIKVSSRGSNDGAAVQRTKSGVPVGILSVPTRYIHSSIETASKTDIDAATALILSFVENCCKHNFDF